MSERLTEKFGAIGCDYLCLEDHDDIVSKLGKLKDIMDKYGIERLEELDSELQDRIDFKCLLAECIKAQQDRDTWKKACELVCKKVRNEYYSDYEIANGYGCNPIYFYQQAQQEKGNK